MRGDLQKTGHYVFNNTDSHEDYLQALMSTVGELDAILKPYGIARRIYACRAGRAGVPPLDRRGVRADP
ncbi:hypothetical protein E0H75_14250 [Kribbella capetownensis]|uniref:Uncharacterized protein n=1 Tax=Kribbella capetownensis TaxID=1572659 RepID=A0A4R0K0V5_9ACTN|nr:hypothetical protein [Kribbella capetownensis]TCC51278.1 hypothetical protein E0H75_14250 [Kribbella capetownensis]